MPRGPAGQHGAASSPAPARRFHLALVKPSHYDDDGYVIQWLRSAIPSNSLVVLHGLALDCAERQVLGSDTVLSVASYDETNTRIRPEAHRPRHQDRRQGAGGARRRAVQP